MSIMKKKILAGDIGGTKTHLALFEEGESVDWTAATKYRSSEYDDLSSIVMQFLKEQGFPEIDRACFGIAGPIQDQKSKTTNLPWIVDAENIKKTAKIDHVSLINDLEANAHGISFLKESEFFTLSPGIDRPGNKALISAGTGLGEAGLFFDGKSYHPFACEGGHCSFAPENEIEIQLLRYLKKQYDHVSYERILSGPGFTRLYQFLIEEGIEKESPKVRAAFSQKDPNLVITEMGISGEDEACLRALEIFVSIYGGEAANLALQMLAVGGIFIGGGIAPKILNEMKEGGFMKRFVQKGRFTSLLLGIPVKIILNENTALIGAGAYAKKNSRTSSR